MIGFEVLTNLLISNFSRNLEIEKPLSNFFLNIRKLERDRNTKFGKDITGLQEIIPHLSHGFLSFVSLTYYCWLNIPKKKKKIKIKKIKN